MKEIGNEYQISIHLKRRIEERGLKKEWIFETINKPDEKFDVADDEVHFFKFNPEIYNKCMKVVVNPATNIIVTAYFDRNKTKKGRK